MNDNLTFSEMLKKDASYQLGYAHGMTAVNELVVSLQTKLAQAKDEIKRLQEVAQERMY